MMISALIGLLVPDSRCRSFAIERAVQTAPSARGRVASRASRSVCQLRSELFRIWGQSAIAVISAAFNSSDFLEQLRAVALT